MTEVTRFLIRVFAILCILAGLLTFPTPIPSGIPLVALGLVLFLTNSRVAPVWMRALRRRSELVDRLLLKVENSAPLHWRKTLRRTGRRRGGLTRLSAARKKPVSQV